MLRSTLLAILLPGAVLTAHADSPFQLIKEGRGVYPIADIEPVPLASEDQQRPTHARLPRS